MKVIFFLILIGVNIAAFVHHDEYMMLGATLTLDAVLVVVFSLYHIFKR